MAVQSGCSSSHSSAAVRRFVRERLGHVAVQPRAQHDYVLRVLRRIRARVCHYGRLYHAEHHQAQREQNRGGDAPSAPADEVEIGYHPPR